MHFYAIKTVGQLKTKFKEIVTISSKVAGPGSVFTKELSQSFGLNVQYKSIQFKPRP